MRQVFVILFVWTFSYSNLCVAQVHRSSYFFGVDIPVSFTDANSSIGAGASGGYSYLLSDNLALNTEVFGHQIKGGGPANNPFKAPDVSGINFSSIYGGVSFSLDLKFYLDVKRTVALAPSLGLGGLVYSTKGTFTDPGIGLILYDRFGSEFLVPVIENDNLVGARLDNNGFASTIEPSLKFIYDASYWMSVYASFGYMITNTDMLDGYFIPVPANDRNDVIQKTQIGLSYKIRNKVRNKARKRR